MQTVLEAAMLMSFSLGWHMSVARMLWTGVAIGKSRMGVLLVCFGYGAGVAAKIVEWRNAGSLDPLVWLYGWNLVVTGFDLFLVVYLTRKTARPRHLSLVPA